MPPDRSSRWFKVLIRIISFVDGILVLRFVMDTGLIVSSVTDFDLPPSVSTKCGENVKIAGHDDESENQTRRCGVIHASRMREAVARLTTLESWSGRSVNAAKITPRSSCQRAANGRNENSPRLLRGLEGRLN